MGAQILLDLGVKDMILLTDTPEKKVVALDGYGLNIVGVHPIRGQGDERVTPNVLIVEARFYAHISDALLDGATAALEDGGAHFERISVPGALEIPPAILFAAKSGEGAGKSFDGFVALGCVIRGETYHFEIVAGESARGLMELGLHHGLCIGNGILTVENEEQARGPRRARPRRQGRRCRARLSFTDQCPHAPWARGDDGGRKRAGSDDARGRRAARLGAVQALYQMELSGQDAGRGDAGVSRSPLRRGRGVRAGRRAGRGIFRRHRARRAACIRWRSTAPLPAGWRKAGSLQRINSILRAILRAAVFEFVARADVPAKVVIDEYVEIAHAFFPGDEPSFVNAILDKIAHRKRAPEFGETPPDDELQF